MDITPKKNEQVFVSKSANLRVVRFAEQRQVFEGGGQRVVAPGLSYQFTDGALRVDDELRKRDERYIERYGEHYSFDTLDDTFLSTEDWLRERAQKTRGFWEQPMPKPNSAETLQEIANALIEKDEDRIAEIYAQEQETFERQDVLGTCVKVLNAIERERAEKAAV